MSMQTIIEFENIVANTTIMTKVWDIERNSKKKIKKMNDQKSRTICIITRSISLKWMREKKSLFCMIKWSIFQIICWK